MKELVCPQCQTINPNGAKFCYNCGTALPEACPNCGAAVIPGARFCYNCGQSLPGSVEPGGAVSPQKPSPPSAADPRLQQYVPKELLARLESARRERQGAPVEGERRIVTVLFSDVRGSTALAEQLDPEEWAEVMNGAFECLIKPVYRYEGIVARLMGDAILAFFGAPIAHEDDPVRAIQAGLDIVDEVRAYRERIKRERGLDLAVRVGINTGLAVVGEVGSDLRVEYTAMGDAVNLAARMEETARPGTVQITGHTYRWVAPLFDVEPLGDTEVRGKSEAVPVYRVVGLKARPGRLRGIEGLSAPLVGRDRELAELRQAAAGVRQGYGQIVCLMGEAGLGKSRLIEELHTVWDQEDGPGAAGPGSAWRESRSPSYAATLPYSAFLELIRRTCGIAEYEGHESVREKVACECLPPGTFAEVCSRVGRVVEVLLGVSEARDGGRLEGETFKKELFQAMLDTWRLWTAAAPTVLVFDDLHWAEPASVELLLHLFQLVDEVPILFLCAFRPDREAPVWQLKQVAERDYPHRYTELVLQPLSPEDSDTLVESLLAVADLPAEMRALIMEKTDGNPFFVEEVIRELIEQGVIVRDSDSEQWRAIKPMDQVRLAIPDNLLALITARIDRLENDTRHTLQLASVVGRTFYYRVLEHVAGLAADLDRQLRALQRGELIREQAREPELEYAFRHALTQEAAYNSILIKRRREFHRQVGETVESLFADRRDEVAPQIAHHFYEARDPRALVYCTLAGDAALRLYANIEAVDHYTRALEAAAWNPAGQADLHHLYSQRGRALELAAHYDRALENYDEMERAGCERGDQSLELSAIVARAVLHATPTPAYDAAKAHDLCNRALNLARGLHDATTEVRILWILMLLGLHDSQAMEGVRYGEQALALARRLGLRQELAYVLNDIALLYMFIGQLADARAVLAEARQLWEDLGDRPMLVDNLSASAGVEVFDANYDEAFRLAGEADRLAQQIGNLWGQAYSQMYIGHAYGLRGEMGRALETFEACLRLAKEAGFMAPFGITRGDLGVLFVHLGAGERGRELLYQARDALRLYMLPWLPRILGELARVEIADGHLAAAEELLDEAGQIVRRADSTLMAFMPFLAGEAELALARHENERAVVAADRFLEAARKMRMYLPEALCLKGRILLHSGRVDEAREVMMEARAEAEGKGLRTNLWPSLIALGEVEERQGREDEANALRRQAGEIVTFIGAHIGDDELRRSFESLPGVQAILSL